MRMHPRLRGVLQLLFSLALLATFILWVGPSDILQIVGALDWRWYSLAFGLSVLSIVIRAVRWYTLLHTLNDQPSLARLIYLYFVGFFANNFIPSGFGGDMVKVASLRLSYGRGTEALSSVLMDRVTGLVGSALLALMALGWNVLRPAAAVELSPPIWLAIILVGTVIPAGFAVLRWWNPLAWLSRRWPRLRRMPFYDQFDRLINTVRQYTPGALLRALLVTLPFTLALVLSHYSIARALNVVLPLTVFLLFVPIIGLVTLLPITFNGLGVREGIYQFLYVPLGVTPAAAVAMSLALYVVRVGIGLLGGALYVLRNIPSSSRSPHAGRP